MEEESSEFIDIKLSSPPKKLPLDLPQDPQLKSSRRLRRRGDTWVISVMVIIQLGFFIATMLVNDCFTNSHGDCTFPSLGRMSFQPLAENPLLGPSMSK